MCHLMLPLLQHRKRSPLVRLLLQVILSILLL
jgi:hypothetical protein